MPNKNIAKMRARANASPQRLSEEEKLKRREEREAKKSAIPTWLVWSMAVIMFGSVVVNIYFAVVTSPKMSG
ncbi:hypothetical protein ABB37_05245 [Leptomonas pyrrhocoris]|uniref:Uncharacterized protein n=1 Tax=Leptomonas pyrrhocoris TaxID=157538 RepID=A0A0M9FZP7_LEPPY|nr:hypothetical protein ABB37_05245 [Leptomonas pyrrhocoris]KPA79395.1 hypothetical protein ABB37_05245 [Leptomonas pyrrhocoris]|eukprot:XP_015657834.1 hypothetical protein ABB37_05245 [Leptomonas pyrrhocoris]